MGIKLMAPISLQSHFLTSRFVVVSGSGMSIKDLFEI